MFQVLERMFQVFERMFQVFERKIYRGLRKSAPRSKEKKEGMSEGFSRAHCMAEEHIKLLLDESERKVGLNRNARLLK